MIPIIFTIVSQCYFNNMFQAISFVKIYVSVRYPSFIEILPRVLPKSAIVLNPFKHSKNNSVLKHAHYPIKIKQHDGIINRTHWNKEISTHYKKKF